MDNADASRRYDPSQALAFATTLFEATGLDPEKAASTASILLEADLMGHVTHGLALIPWYMSSIDAGTMRMSGEPTVISDRGACIAWNGQRLPGTWLLSRALETAFERVGTYGTVTVSIAESHHIGALVAYLTRATERGLFVLLASSSPSAAGVAPYGGRRGVFTPNPIAAGIPTGGEPILIDISASITTLNLSRQMVDAGRRFPHPWALEADGTPTNDPAAVVDRGGTLLPVGGLDHGHKGFGLALIVEALTQGLGGFGRLDQPKGTTSSVFLQVIDPAAFAGRDAFEAQTGWLVDACHDTPPMPGVERVRLPGERGLAVRRESMSKGVVLSDAIIAGLAPVARRFGLTLPGPID